MKPENTETASHKEANVLQNGLAVHADMLSVMESSARLHRWISKHLWFPPLGAARLRHQRLLNKKKLRSLLRTAGFLKTFPQFLSMQAAAAFPQQIFLTVASHICSATS